MPEKAQIRVGVYDGRRRPLDQRVRWLVRLADGRPLSQRRTRTFDGLYGPTALVEVEYFDNAIFDAYTVVVTPDGYQDGAWMPVRVSPVAPAQVEIMVLPREEALNFHQATWQELKQRRPALAGFIANSAGGHDPSAADQYSTVLERRPAALAGFLNIMTALAEMRFPSGRGPLDYYWNLCWPAGDARTGEWMKELDRRFKPDRFFCYVESGILSEFPAALRSGMFDAERDPGLWGHRGATESYKQTQFDVANVQLTFYGNDRASFAAPDGSARRVECVKIEPDMDYYRDLAAHILLEYLPHKLTGRVTDPKIAYMLRWMAARAGGHTFDPLYTIESASTITG